METQDITQASTEELAAQNQQSRSQERIKQLSDKVELTAKERDELKGLVAERDKTIAELQRENTFSSKFADMIGTHPAAKDHKDEIKAKVMSGYDPEDAVLAVLGKAGKLGTNYQPQMPAGGSAATTVAQATKEPKDMNQAERRAQLANELGWS